MGGCGISGDKEYMEKSKEEGMGVGKKEGENKGEKKKK